jgi:hypothetical protein
MLPAIASAESYKCVECAIKRLGMTPGKFDTTDGFVLTVDDPAGKWTGQRVFYLDDSLGKAGYAAALTAFSLGKTVYLRLVDTEPGSLIYGLHINE